MAWRTLASASISRCKPVSGICSTRIETLQGSALSVMLLALAQPVRAAVITNSDCLPPLGSHSKYLADFHLHFNFFGIPVDLTNVVHSAFTDCMSPPLAGSQLESFGSTVAFDASINGGPPNTFTAPAAVQVAVAFNHQTGNTRFFDTEMLQLDISGGTLPAGVLIRESPTLQSIGQTTIEDLGGGVFKIDSFFDVFTELSLDNGNNFVPADRPGRVDLMMPEPASLALLGLILWPRRRR